MVDERSAGRQAGQPRCLNRIIVIALMTKVPGKRGPVRGRVTDPPSPYRLAAEAPGCQVATGPATAEVANVEAFCSSQYVFGVLRREYYLSGCPARLVLAWAPRLELTVMPRSIKEKDLYPRIKSKSMIRVRSLGPRLST